MINECSKLAQKKYKNRCDWVGKVIHWELCKKLKFHHTNKWYVLKPQTDHPIQAWKPNLFLINKKKRTCHLVVFVVPTNH